MQTKHIKLSSRNRLEADENKYLISCTSELARGGTTGRKWGEQPPTPHKGHFCKSSKTEEKKLGV